MAGKTKSFAVGMGSSVQVKNTVNRSSLLNNDIDTGYDLKYIPIEKIVPNKLNKDFSQDDIEKTAYSIQINGLFHALVVVRDENDKYRLISGEKRYHALMSLSKEDRDKQFPMGIPCKIDKIKDNDEVDEEIKVRAANMDARHYTPEQISYNTRRLVELYQIKQERGEISSAVKEIIKLYSLSERQVRKYIAANRMIPELQALLDQGIINITESEKFATFSPDAQKEILDLLQEKGKAEKTDLSALRKAEEEKKQLEAKVLETAQELEDKNKIVSVLEQQISTLENEIKKKDSVKVENIQPTNTGNELEELRHKLQLTEQLLDKEVKEKKRAQSNLEKARQEAEEKRNRKIFASKEELKRAADYAKAENIHELMFKQLKELEKVKDTIKQDDALKVNFAVIAEGLKHLFE